MKPGPFLAILLLGLIALAHLLRLAGQVEVIVGGLIVPAWVSTVGVGVPAVIAGLLWREGRERATPNHRATGASSAHLRPPGLDDLALIVPQAQRLLFAVTQVPGSTLACAARGDAATFATLQAYYTFAAEAADGVGGRFIKGIGDGVLLTFPPERAPAAVQSLRALQERANALWHGFDDRCRVQVKLGAGLLYCGPLGAPGAARFDVVGDALNGLFKAPWSDFHVSPDAAVLL